MNSVGGVTHYNERELRNNIPFVQVTSKVTHYFFDSVLCEHDT